MDDKKALKIANYFLKDMNPNMWDGKENIDPEQIHLDTRIWEERNVIDNTALWINFEPSQYGWRTCIELIDDPLRDDPFCLDETYVYGIDSPQNIAGGIMEICERYNKY